MRASWPSATLTCCWPTDRLTDIILPSSCSRRNLAPSSVAQARKDEVYSRVSFPEPCSVSVIAVGEFEIAPPAAPDPQRHEHVLDRNIFVAELHAVGGQRCRPLARQRHPRRVVDQDSAIAAMLVVPHRVGALRVAALA